MPTTHAARRVARTPLPHTRGDPRLAGALAAAARQLSQSLPVATVHERQFLRDFAREDVLVRKPIPPLAELVRLSRRAADPAAAVAVPEAIRAAIVAERPTPPVSLLEAMHGETRAQLGADEAQWQLICAPQPATRAEAIARLNRQYEATRALIDRLYVEAR